MPTSNRNRYTLRRFLPLLAGIFYTAAAFCVKKRDHIVLNSFLNENFSDNSRAAFEALYQNEALRERIYFVVNNKDKRAALNAVYPGRFISNRSLRDIRIILSASWWVTSFLEFPLPCYLAKYARRVYHLGHGMPYKRVGLMEHGGPWYKVLYYRLVGSNISCVLATSELFRPVVAATFGVKPHQVFVTAQPKTAQLARAVPIAHPAFEDGGATHVLYAPTWRLDGDVRLFPFNDVDDDRLSLFLEDNNIHIWLRLHPRFGNASRAALFSDLHVHFFDSASYPEINRYLPQFDALITDYSSIYFDFLQLQRPVLFFDYDIESYKHDPGLIDGYKTIKSTATTRSMAHFMAQLSMIKSGDFPLAEIFRINKLCNYPTACEDVNTLVVETIFGR